MTLTLVPTGRYVVATGVSLWMLCSEFFLVLKGRHVPVLVGFMSSLQDFITRIRPSSDSRPRLQHVATSWLKKSKVSAIGLGALTTDLRSQKLDVLLEVAEFLP